MTNIQGGAALPVSVATQAPVGGPAIPVAVVSDGRPTQGGAATPVYVVSAAELASGAFRVEGGPARPVVAVSDGRPVAGQRPIPVYVVSGALTPAQQWVAALQALAPTAWWRLADAAGTTGAGSVADSSGNNRPATPTAVTFGSVAGPIAPTAAAFNGTTSVINAYSTSLRDAFNAPAGTLIWWQQVTSSSVFSDGTTRRQIYFAADASNRVYGQKAASFTTTGGLDGGYQAGGTSKAATAYAATGGWQMHAVTWDKNAGGTGELKYFIDGEQVSTTQTSLGTWVGTLASTTTTIGAASTAAANPWSGNLADVVVLPTALTPTQISALRKLIPAAGHVVFDGDSRTVGLQSNATPYYAQALWGNSAMWMSRSYAVGSQSVQAMAADAPTQIDPLVGYPAARKDTVLWGGVNDASGGADAATIHSRIAAYCAARRAAGWRVVVCSEIDAQSAPLNAVNWHSTIWPALNALITANWSTYADALADLGGDARLQDANNVTYFNADKLHLNTTGYGVVAGIVAAVL